MNFKGLFIGVGIRKPVRAHLYVAYDVSVWNLFACVQKNSGDPFMPRKLFVWKMECKVPNQKEIGINVLRCSKLIKKGGSYGIYIHIICCNYFLFCHKVCYKRCDYRVYSKRR